MALPSILKVRRRHVEGASTPDTDTHSNGSYKRNVSKADLKRATKTRRIAVIFSCLTYLLSIIFLILTVVGNTSNSSVISSIYFFKLELADIIPQSAPNARLINSIARTIGLHDFYQVGLWNFCEGYNDEGITYCSKPQNLYWFNPVEILMNELLAGATIALPNQVIQILGILRLASHLMFGFFLTGLVMNFILMILTPLVLRSRWWSLPISILSFISGALIFAAAIIASVISLAFKYAAESQSELNIHADIGVKMFVFMWLASAFTGLCFIIHAGLGCCCASQRDIWTGRKQIREKPTAASTGS